MSMANSHNASAERDLKKAGRFLAVLLLTSMAIPLSFAAGPSVENQTQKSLSPQTMSTIWRSALEGMFHLEHPLTSKQDALLWQAMELGSPEAFSNQEKASAFASLTKQLEAHLPGTHFISTMQKMEPLFGWFEQVGYNMPFCVCNIANTSGRCMTPCVGPAGGILCVQRPLAPGLMADGMCFTTSPF